MVFLNLYQIAAPYSLTPYEMARGHFLPSTGDILGDLTLLLLSSWNHFKALGELLSSGTSGMQLSTSFDPQSKDWMEASQKAIHFLLNKSFIREVPDFRE